jgi:hypothetical protein
MNIDEHRSRRKNTPGDQSMRRSIQDLVSSVDPNVKIDAEVEDVSYPSIMFSRFMLKGGTIFTIAFAEHRRRIHRFCDKFQLPSIKT